MKRVQVLWMVALAVLLIVAGLYAGERRGAPPPTPVAGQAPARGGAEEIVLAANEVVEAFARRDGERLAGRAHPHKGVRFSPYAYVDVEQDRCLPPRAAAPLLGRRHGLRLGVCRRQRRADRLDVGAVRRALRARPRLSRGGQGRRECGPAARQHRRQRRPGVPAGNAGSSTTSSPRPAGAQRRSTGAPCAWSSSRWTGAGGWWASSTTNGRPERAWNPLVGVHRRPILKSIPHGRRPPAGAPGTGGLQDERHERNARTRRAGHRCVRPPGPGDGGDADEDLPAAEGGS